MNWLKEIHAYQNPDGTYRIELLGEASGAPAKVDIGRAAIKIIGYPISMNEPTIFTLEVKE